MIAETQQFFIEVLRFVPFEADLLIQSPHEEVLSVLNEMGCVNSDVFKVVKLSKENRQKLIYEMLYNDIEEYMQNIQIKNGSTLLFEGFDGLEYGTFSKTVELTTEFLEEYTENEMITISLEW